MPVRRRDSYRHSVLVLGTAQLGGPYGIANRTGVPDDQATRRLLRLADRLGVTHVDTARAYGDSERRIGDALRFIESGRLAVVTKVAPLQASARRRPAGVRSAVEESVRRSVADLGAGRRLTILLHRAADAGAGDGVAWDCLRQYLASGVAQRIGVSVQSPDELHGILDLPDLGYVQLPCNVLDRRWLTPDIESGLCSRPELVVTARSVYLQGLLAAGSGVRWPHLTDRGRDEVVVRLDRIAAELGRTDRTDLCMAYVLSLPWVTSVVVGAETEAQLRHNAHLAARPPLGPAERRRLLAELPAVPDDLVDPSRWRP